MALDILTRLRGRAGDAPDGPPTLPLAPAAPFAFLPIAGVDGAVELVVRGRVYAPLVPELRRAFERRRDAGARHLVVDATALEQVDFAGIGLLADMLGDVWAAGGGMVIYGLDPRIERMLEITQLRSVMPTAADRTQALARIGDAPAGVDPATFDRIRRHIRVVANAGAEQPPGEELPRQALARVAYDYFVRWVTERGIPNRDDAWDRLRAEATVLVQRLARDAGFACSPEDCAQVAALLVSDLCGLGPIQAFLDDPLVTEVMVSGAGDVLIERAGALERTDVRFRDNEHLMHTIRRIAERVGRRIDFANPSLDARLDDGSRVHALVPPVAIDGPTLSIRKFGVQFRQLEDLIVGDMLSPDIAYYLGACVKSRLNVVIGGPAASGKTTLLQALAAQVPLRERLVTIEEITELDLSEVHPNVVRLQARQANTEGKGEVTIRQLVREALRMRADRILVGEARGAEMIEVLQAMRCGHDGSMTTIHASSPSDLIERATTIALFANLGLSDDAVRRMVIDALDVIVFLYRFADGHRRVVRVTEPYRTAQGDVALNDVFTFDHEGYDAAGRVQGGFRLIGPSRFDDRFRRQGIEVPWAVFARGVPAAD
ncbi:MAG TPA: ATPase, T2SS/T4P/T4SS family [Candidatus Limnocylindria bacterium]|nr:ATPase, T2SS/T4P/T4SS family [Candidatus Limnocylindria bacterium]